MKIAVIGTGYVGLVTGTCFAESGNDVICVDKVAEKIANLEQGIIPIYEPGLAELVDRDHRDGRLRFTTNLAEGMSGTALSHDQTLEEGKRGAAALGPLLRRWVGSLPRS